MAMNKPSLLVFLANNIKLCRGVRTKPSETHRTEQKPNQNEKVVKIAIIGTPNAGKSTFINNLLNHRICAASTKVHTTRTSARAIGVRNNSQVILFDTPGLVTEQEMKKHNLSNEFLTSCRRSIQNSDLVGVIHDVSNSWTRSELHSTVLDTLQTYANVPSFLVLNKIDCLKSKRMMLDITRTLTQNTLLPRGIKNPKLYMREQKLITYEDKEKKIGWPGFSDVFMVSSLTGDGMDDVMKFLLRHTKNRQWEYGSGEYTDQPPETLIVEGVRARLLSFLPQEIPYLLKCELEFYSTHKGHIFTSVVVTCPTERIERLVCGKENGKLKQITELVTSDLVETFQKPVSLTISMRSNKKSD
ncbi:GTPase Era, mitochondrial [Bradysia coprophila]|uniref:GTPase Era, mitochondrial n=1 Tax=Bradysia coprophila TaxID=38358 RepID=UPI00187D77B6|nr:GTPase Era, mitochondrial [Bradysia coprophila]